MEYLLCSEFFLGVEQGEQDRENLSLSWEIHIETNTPHSCLYEPKIVPLWGPAK